MAFTCRIRKLSGRAYFAKNNNIRQSIHLESLRAQRCGAGWHCDLCIFERLLKCVVELLIMSRPASSAGTIEVTSCSMTVRTASRMFGAIPRFFATAFWQCKDIIVNYALPFLGIRRKRVLETTASKAQPEQYDLSVWMWIALTSMSCSKV